MCEEQQHLKYWLTAGCRENNDHDKEKHTNVLEICICMGPNIFLLTEVGSLIAQIMWTS